MKHPVLARLHKLVLSSEDSFCNTVAWGQEGQAGQGMHLFQKQSRDLASKFKCIQEV